MVFLAVLFVTPVAGAERVFEAGVWGHCLGASSIEGAWYWPDDRFEAALADPRLVYLHHQVTLDAVIPPTTPDSYEKGRERIRRWAAADKRVILQLWANCEGTLNWSHYSMCHLAQRPNTMLRFCSYVFDFLDWVGAENLYAVCLWEENAGTQIGWDLQQPGDWRRNAVGIVDGADNGQQQGEDRPWLIGRDAEKFDGPYMPNARVYRDKMLAETGVDMLRADEWGEEDWRAWRRWASREFVAQTNAHFAEQVHARYPHLKVYSWCYPAMAGDKFTDLGYEAAHGVDGVIVDPYFMDVGQVYADARTCRTIFGPQADVHVVLHGGREPAMRTEQLAAVWRAGADSCSWWSGDNTAHWWALQDWVSEAFARLGRRPVMAAPYRTLVVSDGYYEPAANLFPLLGRFDVVSSQDRYSINESRYEDILDCTDGPQVTWGAK